MKYKTKTATIEAHKWTGILTDEVPPWLQERSSEIYLSSVSDGLFTAEIETADGTMLAHPGDYIIAGKGEIYPIRGDIFETLCEEAKE